MSDQRAKKSLGGKQWVSRIDHTVLHLAAQIIREILGKRGNGVGRTQGVDYPEQSRCVAILTHGDALERQAIGIQRDPHQVPSELGEHRNQVAPVVHDENRREHSLIHRLDNLGE